MSLVAWYVIGTATDPNCSLVLQKIPTSLVGSSKLGNGKTHFRKLLGKVECLIR